MSPKAGSSQHTVHDAQTGEEIPNFEGLAASYAPGGPCYFLLGKTADGERAVDAIFPEVAVAYARQQARMREPGVKATYEQRFQEVQSATTTIPLSKKGSDSRAFMVRR